MGAITDEHPCVSRPVPNYISFEAYIRSGPDPGKKGLNLMMSGRKAVKVKDGSIFTLLSESHFLEFWAWFKDA